MQGKKTQRLTRRHGHDSIALSRSSVAAHWRTPMTKEWKVLRLLMIGLPLSGAAMWIGIFQKGSIVLAQSGGQGAERQTINIDRKPSRRWVREDPYATFNFVTLDED